MPVVLWLELTPDLFHLWVEYEWDSYGESVQDSSSDSFHFVGYVEVVSVDLDGNYDSDSFDPFVVVWDEMTFGDLDGHYVGDLDGN